MAIDLFIAYQFYQKKTAKEIELHEASKTIEQKLHLRDQNQAKLELILDMTAELERHVQQLNADVLLSCREAERDMFDQYGEQFRTLTLAGTIMLISLITVLIQGVLASPPGPPVTIITNSTTNSTFTTFYDDDYDHYSNINTIYTCYAIANAGALTCIILSIILSTEIVAKTASKMYRRGRDYRNILTKESRQQKISHQKFKAFFSKIRSQMSVDEVNAEWHNNDEYRKIMDDRNRHLRHTRDFLGNSKYKSKAIIPVGKRSSSFSSEAGSIEPTTPTPAPTPLASSVPFQRPTISNAFQFNSQSFRLPKFTSIDNELGSSRSTSFKLPTKHSQNFDELWKRHWRFRGELAVLFFYIGTSLMMTAHVLYMWSSFLYHFHTIIASFIAVGFLVGAMMIGFGIFIYLNYKSYQECQKTAQSNDTLNSRDSIFQWNSTRGLPKMSSLRSIFQSAPSARSVFGRQASMRFRGRSGSTPVPRNADAADEASGSTAINMTPSTPSDS